MRTGPADIAPPSPARRHRLGLRPRGGLNRLSSLDGHEVLRAITRAAAQIMGAPFVCFWSADDAHHMLTGAAASDEKMWADYPTKTVSFDDGVIGQVASTRRAIRVADVFADPRIGANDWFRRHSLRSYYGLPIVFGKSLLGVLSLHGTIPFRVRRPEHERLAGFAEQAAFAIENARLYQESERQRRSLATLVEVSQRLTRGLELPVVLGAIADAAAQLFGGDAGFRLIDGNELVRIGATPGALRAMIRERMPIGASISGRVAQIGEPIVTADNAADPRGIPEDRSILKRNLMRAQMCVPIRLGVRVLGVLQVYREVGYHFDEQAVQIAMTFADQAAVAIENARLYQESESRRKRLATLVEVSQRLTRGLDLPSVLGSIADAAAQLFEGEAGFRIVEGDDLVRVGATPGARQAMVRERLRIGESITGQVALTGEPIVSDDSAADLRMSADHRAARLEHPQIGSLMCVPIRLGTHVLGTLNIYREVGHHFDEDSRRMAMTFADQAAIAIENARIYGQAQAQATALEAKNAELDSFAYMVSHDLKTPLVTIQGMASMLALDCAPALDDRGRHYLARIEANIGQMEQLISDLLALSRVGREARPSEAVCLSDVVDEVLAGLAERIRVRGVKVERGDLGAVWGIRTQLAQVFTNLISNAVKYLGDVAEPRVAIGASDRGSWIECYIRDNGIGIDPAYHGKVFELFQRLKEVPVEGSGVGLPIVKRIVEAAGGRIWVESAKGHGATFFFTWPKTARSR